MERQRMVMEKTEELGNEHKSTWKRVQQVKRRERSWRVMERERMVMEKTGEMGKRTQDDEQRPKGVVRRRDVFLD
jgi:hypothetical protein